MKERSVQFKWSDVFLEKLMCSQIVKNISYVLGNLTFYYNSINNQLDATITIY